MSIPKAAIIPGAQLRFTSPMTGEPMDNVWTVRKVHRSGQVDLQCRSGGLRYYSITEIARCAVFEGEAA